MTAAGVVRREAADDEFLSLADNADPWRPRRNADRAIGRVAPSEIDEGLLLIVSKTFGAEKSGPCTRGRPPVRLASYWARHRPQAEREDRTTSEGGAVVVASQHASRLRQWQLGLDRRRPQERNHPST